MKILPITKPAALLVALLLLSSCFPKSVTINDLQAVNRDMTEQQFYQVIPLKPLCVFPANNGMVHIHVLVTNALPEKYAFYFVNHRLKYWGYPHEYNREPNASINQAGRIIDSRLKQGFCPRKRK